MQKSVESSQSGSGFHEGFLRISITEATLFAIFGLIVTLIGRTMVFFQGNSAIETIHQPLTQALFTTSLETYLPNLSSFILWAGVGALLYLLVWCAISILTYLRNDIVIAKLFHHPDNFSRAGYWSGIVIRSLARFAAGVVLLITALYVVKLGRYWYGRGTLIGSHQQYLLDAKIIALAMLSMLILGYLASIALRVIMLRRRVF